MFCERKKLRSATVSILALLAAMIAPLCGPLCAVQTCASFHQTDAADCHGEVTSQADAAQSAIHAAKSCALQDLLVGTLSSSTPKVVRSTVVFLAGTQPSLATATLSLGSFLADHPPGKNALFVAKIDSVSSVLRI